MASLEKALASVTGLVVVVVFLALCAFSSLEYDLQHPPPHQPGHAHQSLDKLLLSHGARDVLPDSLGENRQGPSRLAAVGNGAAGTGVVPERLAVNLRDVQPPDPNEAAGEGRRLGNPTARPSTLNPELVPMFRPVLEGLRRSAPPRHTAPLKVEVWGKAAIGNYLFQHVLAGWVESRLGGVWHYGEARCGNLQFRYRTGHGVRPSKVPQDAQHVVLVLNAHETHMEKEAMKWMDLLPKLAKLQHAVLVLHAREDCENDWLRPYLKSPAHKLRAVFMTYGGKVW